MDEEFEQRKANGLAQCDRLISELSKFLDDTDLFFGGEIYKTYINATEKALNKAKTIRTKLRNL